MISSFLISLFIGILCVKQCCLSNGFRSFAHEVRMARRAIRGLDHSHESDGWSGGSESGNNSMESDIRSESSTYSNTVESIQRDT